MDDLRRFGVDENHLRDRCADQRWRALMQFEIQRSRALMLKGAPLALTLPGRIGWELRLVIQGGLRILEKIEAVEFDVFNRRPVLSKTDWIVMTLRAMRMSRMGHRRKVS
jgi:phytoene/squalene synthetase